MDWVRHHSPTYINKVEKTTHEKQKLSNKGKKATVTKVSGANAVPVSPARGRAPITKKTNNGSGRQPKQNKAFKSHSIQKTVSEMKTLFAKFLASL